MVLLPVEIKGEVLLTHDTFDALRRDGYLHETGRRMIDDLVPGNFDRVRCGGELLVARVKMFNRPPSKKNLVIEWAIELVRRHEP